MTEAVLSAPPPKTSRITAEIAGTRLEVLETGAQRLQTLLVLIDAAERSIRMLFYMFADDRAGEAVRDALARAAARGVDVDLLIDGFGSDVSAGFFDPLKKQGGKLCLFHPSYGRR